ncbi:MAG: 50S ribosomal protein L9 [Saprospiraceae bacterium]|nr:50S ribosomal protein L9 [Saprospiraceae bacterium]
MEIILLEDVEKVGGKFEIVKVKNGFGRNYLIPQGIAIIANGANMKRLEDYKRREAAKTKANLGIYQDMATKLADAVLKIGAKSGTSGKIFGSVTNVQIVNALKEQFGLEVERRKVIMPDEVKNLGDYEAELKLHPEVEIKVKFEVVSE